MKVNRRFLLVLFSFCAGGFFSFYTSFAKVKGSESNVSIEPAYTFPAADSDNKMLGFGWFKNGFSLEDNKTTCTFDSVYPVSGDVSLNGGTLYLVQDLIFKNKTILSSFGTIVGNNYLCELCSSIQQLPADKAVFKDVTLLLSSDLVLTDTVVLQGNCRIIGDGHDIFLQDSGCIIIDSGSCAHFTDVTLEDVNSCNFIVKDDTSHLVFENINWKQHDDYSFSKGSILFLNENNFIGSYTFTYESKLTSTIGNHSKWVIQDGLRLEIGRKSSVNDPEPIYFEDETSTLNLNGCSFVITEYGWILKKGRIEVDSDVNLEVMGDEVENGLHIGSGLQEDDFTLHLNSGASLKFKTGQLVYNNYNDSGLTALSESARVLRYGPSKVYVARDWVFPSMVLKVHSGVPETVLKEGVSFGYNRSKIIFSAVEYDFSGRQFGSYHFYLTGNDYLYLSKGTFITPLVVQGTNNIIYGTGNFTGNVILQDSDAQLVYNLNGLILADAYLNGSTVTLGGDLALGADATFKGGGIVDLSGYNLELSGLDSTWTSTIEWKNTDGAINLNSKVNLSGIWVFKDSCVINGNGHTLDVGKTGQILVDDGAQLTLRNVNLHMVSQDDIRCLSNNSSIVLDNTNWVQDAHISFDLGSLKIINNVDFIGSYSFLYNTDQSCVISQNSTLNITKGIKAYFGKKSLESLEPIIMQDSTSTLRLDDCSFIVTNNGVCIKKGKIEIDRNFNLEVVGDTIETGLMLGSGKKEDDVFLCLSSGCAFNFRSGQVVYNNTVNNGFVAMAESAQVTRYADSNFHVMSDLVFPRMLLRLHSGVPITTRAPGVGYRYDKVRMLTSNAEFDFKGEQATSTVFLLQGGDKVYMNKGVFILPVLVSGKDNRMFGSGNISGPIIFQDPNGDLSFNLNGLLLSNIMLNGGNMRLDGDLSIGGDYKINGPGTVSLKEYNLSFGNHDSVWNADLIFECGCGGSHEDCFGCPRSINLNSYTKLDGAWQFNDSCIIDGNGNSLEISEFGKILVGDNVKLILRDMIIRVNSERAIECLTDTGKIEFNNVTLVQGSDFVFDKGSMRFVDNVEFVGAYNFFYDSCKTSTIAYNSTWKITGDMVLKIGKKSTNASEPLYLEEASSTFSLDNCSLHIVDSGVQFINGKILVSRDVDLEIEGETVDTGLMLGNGQQGHDASVYMGSGACLRFKTGQLVYNGHASDCIVAMSEDVRIVRYGPSRMHMATDLIFPTMNLKVHSGAPVTTREEGVSFTYDNSRVIFENVEFDFQGRQNASDTFLLEGNGFLYLSKGVFMLPLAVSGIANQLYGTGNIGTGMTDAIMLQDSNTDLICYLNGVVWGNILLNGGSLTLYDDLQLGGNIVIEGPGQIRLMRYNVVLGGQDSIWTSTIDWHSNGFYACPYNLPRGIDLNSQVTLLGKWNMQDCCVINGHGHTLNLEDLGKIEVQPGVCLTLRNMTIHTTGENQIYCADDTGSITFDNVTWLQDSDVIFDTGSMKFVNSVDFIGSSSFVYDSCQTSTIADGSCWKITGGMKFRIGKKEKENAVEPLCFTNKTSSIKFDDCSFIVTGSGMVLTKGVIEVDREVNLEILGTTTSNGLTLGTGVEEEDAEIQANSGAALRFRTGMLVYNNYGDNGVVALSKNARFIRYGPSKTHIKRDWLFPQMTLKVDSGIPETTLADGVNFRYDNAKFVFENAKFDFLGRQYGGSLFALEGNDFFYFSKGSTLMPIFVSGTGNMVHGTGNITGAIYILESGADLIFNLIGEIWEDIYLNNSKIILYNNLYFGGDHTIKGAGQVCLMRYNIVLGGQDSVWESTINWHSNGLGPCPYNYPRGIDLNAKVKMKGRWNIQDNCVINGNGNMLCLGKHGKIEVQDGVCLTLRNLILHTKAEKNIYCTSDSSSIIFDNVTWIQDEDVTFDKGSMKFENNTKFMGPYTFTYDSMQTSTIGGSSRWTITNGMTLCIGKKEQTSAQPLYFTCDTSILKLDNCSFMVTGSGMNLTRGIVEVDRDVSLDIMGTTTSTGLMVGNGIEGEDVCIQANSGAALMFKSGQLVFNNYSSNFITPLSEGARFIRYGPSKTYMARNVEFPEMTLKVASGFPETVLASGTTFTYNNTHMVFTNVAFNYTGVQYHSNTFALSGGSYIYLDKGAFMLPITVAGPANTIFGTGSFSGPIFLQDSNAELMFGLNGNIGSSVSLNGGKITLSDDLNLSGGVHFIGSGSINLAGYRLSLGQRDIICEGIKSWDGGSDGSIDIRSKIDLRDTWNFSSSCIINGHGNTLDLSNNGELVVQEDAHLVLHDIKIIGISESNIRCADDTGVITLNGVTWVQDSNYTFTTGALKIKNSTKMTGAHNFYYETVMTSTVLQDSSWKFGPGFEFNYAPISNSKDLIQLTDETSFLKFNNADMFVSSVGIDFKKGNILARGECNFASEIEELEDGTVINEGITIGSGQIQDDCVLTIGVGSILNFTQGGFTYNNISPASFIMENQISHLRILSGTELRLSQNLNLGDGILYMSETTRFDFAEGKNIIGTVFFVE